MPHPASAKPRSMPSLCHAKPEKCQALIQCWPRLLSMGLKKVRWSVESPGSPLGPPACLTWSRLPCRFTTGKPSCLTGLEPPAVPGHRWEDLLPAWPKAACCGGTPLGRPPACLAWSRLPFSVADGKTSCLPDLKLGCPRISLRSETEEKRSKTF